MVITGTEARTASGLRVSMPLPGIVRVTDGSHKDSCMVSAPLRRRAPRVEGDALIWGKLRVEPDNGMALYYGGRLLCRDHTPGATQEQTLSQAEVQLLQAEGHSGGEQTHWAVTVTKALSADAVIYGLGDKTGFLNKRGYEYVNWNSDDPKPHCDNYKSLYKSVNFFMVFSGDGCIGILADNTYRTRFDFGKESPDRYTWAHEGGALDYYMIPGRTPKDVLLRYQALTGQGKLQQKWVYGFHQSRWSYMTEPELLEVVDTMRANRLPIDAVHMDIDYMDGFRVFTFDRSRYPDPRGTMRKLAQRNVKAITIIDPGVKLDPGYFVYDEGVEQGHFAKNPDGSIYEGAVWPGPSVFPDFTREDTRLWWGDKVRLMTDIGVRGIWNDMNEPANFTGELPPDVQFRYGDQAKVHNTYGHFMAQATYEGLLRAENRRPFVLTRACCAGSQRYCSAWTGDNHSIWSHLQLVLTQMMNLGLSGMNLTGGDVGGFGSDTTPELLVRWMQLGAISPFFRNHYAKGTRRQEVYVFGQKTTGLCRKALDLRYHLLPYLYDLAHQELPMLRPLVLEFPEDTMCRELTDQCMLGSSLLCAPVMTPGVTARAVYLPRGTWYDYHTGRRYQGGRYVLADAPEDRMPIFARAGAIIPVAQGKPQCVEDITQVELEVFPGSGSFTHFTDDGETMDYQHGAIHRLAVTVRGRQVSQTVTASGYPGPEQLPVRWMDRRED